jgi:hypothetical protein
MRLLITSPCYIESDGPILIEPLRDEVHPIMDDVDVGGGRPRDLYTLANEPHTAEVFDTNPQPLVLRRKSRATTALTCKGCGVRFHGRANQMYHDAQCKMAFYRRRKVMGAV